MTGYCFQLYTRSNWWCDSWLKIIEVSQFDVAKIASIITVSKIFHTGTNHKKKRFHLLHCIDRYVIANVEISCIRWWPFWRGLNMLRASRCHRWHHCWFTFDFYWMLPPIYMDPIEALHAINNQSMIMNWWLVSIKNTSNNAVIELHAIAYMKTNNGGTHDEIK